MALAAPRVFLASMPWAKLAEPSLGLGILKSVLARDGIASRVRHFNVELLKYLKDSSYAAIADMNALNEFLFTEPLEHNISASQLLALSSIADGLMSRPSELSSRGKTRAEFIDYFLMIRNSIFPKYLDECAQVIIAEKPTLVGFTCLYDQTFASLALAARIKARLPDAMIAFGGYALEGEAGLELLRCFDCVDVVAFGDGEPAITPLARSSVGAVALSDVPNIAWRDGAQIRQTRRIRIDMRDSPLPAFEHFFADIAELEQEHAIRVSSGVIPLETSRGCWWGQKNHCTFCGIDEETLNYRQRPAEQAINMITDMAEKYPGKTLRLVDYILPHSYFKTVLPHLAARAPGPRLTCEVKANLTAEKITLLRDAGFVEVQPGIESFSTPVLRRMRKGVTGIQNILTLKIGKARNIKIDWNILYGFPDDRLEDYEDLVKTIPHLYHLDPPFSCGDVLVTRFAPLQTTPERFGLQPAGKHKIYDVLLSEDYMQETGLRLERMCYLFDSPWEIDSEIRALYSVVDGQVDHWKTAARAHKKPRLTHSVDGDTVTFFDRRMLSGDAIIRTFPREIMEVYSIVHERIMTIRDLLSNGLSIPRTRAEDILQLLIEERLVFREGDCVLGLSLDGYVPDSIAAARRQDANIVAAR